MSVGMGSDTLTGRRYETSTFLFPILGFLSFLTLINMAANGARSEQPQKRAGAKDKQNGKSAG